MERFGSILCDFMREHICVQGRHADTYFETLADGMRIDDHIEALCKHYNMDYGMNWETTPCGDYTALVVDWMTPDGNDNIIFFIQKGTVED